MKLSAVSLACISVALSLAADSPLMPQERDASRSAFACVKNSALERRERDLARATIAATQAEATAKSRNLELQHLIEELQKADGVEPSCKPAMEMSPQSSTAASLFHWVCPPAKADPDPKSSEQTEEKK